MCQSLWLLLLPSVFANYSVLIAKYCFQAQCQTVALDVVGSTPTTHPNDFWHWNSGPITLLAFGPQFKLFQSALRWVIIQPQRVLPLLSQVSNAHGEFLTAIAARTSPKDPESG